MMYGIRPIFLGVPRWSQNFLNFYGLVSHLALPSLHYQVPCLWRQHLKLRCYHHLLLKLISVSLRNIDSFTSCVQCQSRGSPSSIVPFNSEIVQVLKYAVCIYFVGIVTHQIQSCILLLDSSVSFYKVYLLFAPFKDIF